MKFSAMNFAVVSISLVLNHGCAWGPAPRSHAEISSNPSWRIASWCSEQCAAVSDYLIGEGIEILVEPTHAEGRPFAIMMAFNPKTKDRFEFVPARNEVHYRDKMLT